MGLFDANKYPILARATSKLDYNTNALLDRDDTLESILAVFHKTEMSNVLLMGEAGQGKTAVMQEFARRYANQYLVLTTSIPQLTNDQTGNVSTNFKELFNEITAYRRQETTSRPIVLFIDEFHVLPKESPAAVEDLKPEFARSSQRGIYLVGATTYKEYHDDIEPNEAFKQRFDIVKLPITDDKLTYKILKDRMRNQYRGYIEETAQTDKILKEIIQYTDNFVKDSEQPRKATNVLDEMIGWTRIGKKFNHDLLVHLFALNKNIRLDLQADVTKLQSYLESRVFDQQLAIESMMNSAYASILNLTDPNKPRNVVLFVGSTGTGKTELAKAFTQGMFGPDSRLSIFDMAEYKSEDSIKRFQYTLTDTVLAAPTPVILLDEIDRCAKGINELLFSVFDEARLHDRNGREVNFSNVFFIMTTNRGEDIFNDIDGKGYTSQRMSDTLQKLTTLIKENLKSNKDFPAPLLTRIKDFIMFVPISEKTGRKIVDRELHNIQAKCMTKQNVQIRFDRNSVINYVTNERSDPRSAGGARELVNIVNKDVLSAIARHIVYHPDDLDLYVSTVGQGRTNNKNHAISKERIQVAPTNNEILTVEYKKAVRKYKPEVVQALKKYLAIDRQLQLSPKINKDIFRALAHNGTDLPADVAVAKVFKPLADYLHQLESWDMLYQDHPDDAPSARPKSKVNVYFEHNQMQIE